MGRMFISPASVDNDQAAEMKDWLANAGFESAFLDKDKTTGIPPGADWERTLYREVPAVRASAWRCTTIWMPTGMPSIASIGTVTAGAPRIEVRLLKTESPVLPRPRVAGP